MFRRPSDLTFPDSWLGTWDVRSVLVKVGHAGLLLHRLLQPRVQSACCQALTPAPTQTGHVLPNPDLLVLPAPQVDLPMGESMVPNLAVVQRAQREDLNTEVRYQVCTTSCASALPGRAVCSTQCT